MAARDFLTSSVGPTMYSIRLLPPTAAGEEQESARKSRGEKTRHDGFSNSHACSPLRCICRSDSGCAARIGKKMNSAEWSRLVP